MAIKKIKLPDNTEQNINDARITSTNITKWNATASSLENYLPLVGGTMTADAAISWGTNDRTDWATVPDGIRVISSTDTASGAPTQYAVGMTIKSRYSFSLASRGGTADSFYFKSGARNWYEVYHSGNLTQSVVTGLIGSSTYAPYNADGYLPLSGGTMANTNLVTNMNADLLDGFHETRFFRGRGTVPANTDISTYSGTVGSYFLNALQISTITNAPYTQSGLHVFSSGSNYGDLQIVSRPDVLDFRVKWGSTDNSWKNWHKIWHDANSNLSTVDWAANNITAAGYISSGTYVNSSGLKFRTNANRTRIDATGWYRVWTGGARDTFPTSIILNITKNFGVSASEGYLIEISLAGNGQVTFNQISGTTQSSARNITKIRYVYVYNTAAPSTYIDIYYSGTAGNDVNISGLSGHGTFSAPTLVEDTTGYTTVEFETQRFAFKTTRAIVAGGNITGASFIKTGGTSSQLLAADGSTRSITISSSEPTSSDGSNGDIWIVI